MPPCPVFSVSLTLGLLFAYADVGTGSNTGDHFSINCGSSATSTALSGREWYGDHNYACPKSSFVSIKGASTASSICDELRNHIDPVPYRTARISTSKFSYSLRLNPGKKFIRLHFNPTSYYGDKRFHDLFTVEAGPVTLLANFSASTTARALGYTTFTKEFCATVQGNQPLDLKFTPVVSTSSSRDKFFYAFINGIEIITVLPGLSYCHAGDVSVQDAFSLPRGYGNSVTSLVIAVICAVNIIIYKLRQNWEVDFCEEENRLLVKAKHLCRRFSLPEIQSATDNFHDGLIIGKGGFGDVYKGFIDNKQQTVAIKRLKSNSSQGECEFWTEIETLSELRHVNLVSLIGYCYDQREMILVYEHVPSGSLADHLYKLSRKNKAYSPLSWKQRLKVCIGAGRGLDYLHTGHGIIHRDVKTSNILLDKNFVPKISDFGLAKTKDVGDQLQKRANASVKGTFGYLDPNYFKTCMLTTKCDTYSFGVVLLEVLCGRPAVEELADEDECSLTKWARDSISRGEVYQIVAPSLREEISPSSLTTFIRIVERCIDDIPDKRPAIAHVLINLEFALEQQENQDPWSLNGMTSVSDFFPRTDKAQKEHSKPLLRNMVTSVTNLLTCYDTTFLSRSSVKFPCPLKENVNRKMVSTWKKDRRKMAVHNLLRIWPWDASRNTAKQSKNGEMPSNSVSEPLSCDTRIDSARNSTALIFNLSALETITRNFSVILGEGGFGKVYKGWLDKEWAYEAGGICTVAVKRLNNESNQGFTEWQNEVQILANFSHPNVVKLLGYCSEDNELLLVYEYMSKGALDTKLFNIGVAAVEPLGWNIRVKILIGAARGLAFLHESDRNIVYRDVKTSNILLDESYNAKLADFGLARWVPTNGSGDVSTRVIGTYGYVAPDYVATGHLNLKCDSYSFGVVMVEMLTGLRVVDRNRPSEQRNLVDWIKPLLPNNKKRNTMKFMDPRLEGRYPTTSAFQMARLARNCLESDPKKRPSLPEIVRKLERLDPLMLSS